MRQARVVDIHQWYRTGGINYAELDANFDAVGVRACQGFDLDDLYQEHAENLERIEKPFFTYAIPEFDKDPVEQADFYYEIPGVRGRAVCGDIEPAGGGMVNEYQARKFFERLGQRAAADGFDPWYYSNYNYTMKIGAPAWIQPLLKFWAEYPIDLITKYRRFDRYFSKKPWWIPKWAVRLGYTPELHQFTDYGDAQYYLANAKTADPDYRDGIKSADLSVSLIDVEAYLALLRPYEVEPSLEQRVADLEQRVAWLETFHK